MPLYKDGNVPSVIKGLDRRDVIVMEEGLVKISKAKNPDGSTRVKKELLYASDKLAEAAGSPMITNIDFLPKVNSNNQVSNVNVEVSFNQEIQSKSPISIQVRNSTTNQVQSATSNNYVSYNGNTLNFFFQPNAAGNYMVPPQTISAEGKVVSKLNGKSIANSITNSLLGPINSNIENILGVGVGISPDLPESAPTMPSVPMVSLNALSLSGTNYETGSASGTLIGNITGKTDGSILTLLSNGSRVALVDDKLVVGTVASSAGTVNVTITETLDNADNSPRVNNFTLNVAATVVVEPPVILTGSTFTVAENSPWSITLTADKTVTWSKVGGADANLFTLSGSTLSLTAKDFEVPVDSNLNNIYDVTIRATDSGGLTANRTIRVTITDVVEPDPPYVWTMNTTGIAAGSDATMIPEVTRLTGNSGAISVNSLGGLSTSDTSSAGAVYRVRDLKSYNQFVEFQRENVAPSTAGPLVLLWVSDSNNWIGVRDSTNAYDVVTSIGGSKAVSKSTTGVTPAANDSVVFSVTRTATNTCTISLTVNGVNRIAPYTINTVPESTFGGFVSRTNARNPWVRNGMKIGGV